MSKEIPPAINKMSCFFSFFNQIAQDIIKSPIIPKTIAIIINQCGPDRTRTGDLLIANEAF